MRKRAQKRKEEKKRQRESNRERKKEKKRGIKVVGENVFEGSYTYHVKRCINWPVLML